MPGKISDAYANLAAINLTMSGADTLTFDKFDFPVSVMEKVGLLISRIEYFFLNLSQLNSSGDYAVAAITVSKNTASLIDIEDPTIIDSARVLRFDVGAAASGFFYDQPVIRDLSTLPGGGLLVAPNPLYVAENSVGAGAALGVAVRMYYTLKDLKPDEYWQLVESRRIVTD